MKEIQKKIKELSKGQKRLVLLILFNYIIFLMYYLIVGSPYQFSPGVFFGSTYVGLLFPILTFFIFIYFIYIFIVNDWNKY